MATFVDKCVDAYGDADAGACALTLIAGLRMLRASSVHRKLTSMRVALVLCGSLAVGCTDASPHAQPDTMPDVELPELDPALQARVDAAVASVRSDPCVTQNDATKCQWADYEIGPGQLDLARSTGEAILVIDHFGRIPELLRSRNRIAGYYKIAGDHLEPQTVAVHLPERVGDVLVSFADAAFVPASSLIAVGNAVFPAYGALLPRADTGHGDIVLGHLLDLVPEQPLVLLDLESALGIPREMCDLGITSETAAAATAHTAAIAGSLQQAMTKHNVRFVNASFGATMTTVAASWETTCKTAVPDPAQLRALLHTYDPLYATLFNSEGVIAAHAATMVGSPEDFPFDQVNAQYPNQVRAGLFLSVSSGLDSSGRGAVRMEMQYPGDGDADAYLNWNCEGYVKQICAAVHYKFVVSFGLRTFTFPAPATSFITPLVLARLINLRYGNHANEPMTNALIQTLKQELTPSLCGPDGTQPCVYQDPIAHDQLEIYRLGYLAPPVR